MFPSWFTLHFNCTGLEIGLYIETPDWANQPSENDKICIGNWSDIKYISIAMDTSLMYQSIPSLTIPPSPSDPRGFARFHCPEDPVFAQISFELDKFSTVSKEKCRNFSICFKETGGGLKSRCSCAVSYQEKMSTVSLITQTIFGHFSHFDKILRSVIFATTRSSLKFWVSYIARFIINIRSISRPAYSWSIDRVYLIYSQSRKP